MRPIYQAALATLRARVASFDAGLYGPKQERVEAIRISMRERRDYWHALGSRIKQRMDRERDRK